MAGIGDTTREARLYGVPVSSSLHSLYQSLRVTAFPISAPIHALTCERIVFRRPPGFEQVTLSTAYLPGI